MHSPNSVLRGCKTADHLWYNCLEHQFYCKIWNNRSYVIYKVGTAGKVVLGTVTIEDTSNKSEDSILPSLNLTSQSLSALGSRQLPRMDGCWGTRSKLPYDGRQPGNWIQQVQWKKSAAPKNIWCTPSEDLNPWSFGKGSEPDCFMSSPSDWLGIDGTCKHINTGSCVDCVNTWKCTNGVF